MVAAAASFMRLSIIVLDNNIAGYFLLLLQMAHLHEYSNIIIYKPWENCRKFVA